MTTNKQNQPKTTDSDYNPVGEADANKVYELQEEARQERKRQEQEEIEEAARMGK
jgi:hypothetical protein